jgi:FkbM family methyltransferase
MNVGDINIRHPWTSETMKVHSFKHKGYWFYRKSRERESMELFARLVPKEACVLDVGGHIGYTALYFSSLVGPRGDVFVFEPSPENLPYLAANVEKCTRGNVMIVRAAIGDHIGMVRLSYEAVTGQNATIVPEFQGFYLNCSSNNLAAQYQQCDVHLITIDNFVNEHRLSPHFVKIDVEGAELKVLDGMASTIDRYHPRLMVEVNLHGEIIWQKLSAMGYQMYSPAGIRLQVEDLTKHTRNVFAHHKSDSLAESVVAECGERSAARRQ